MREKEEVMDENLLKYGTPGLTYELITNENLNLADSNNRINDGKY
jgi:hypothetical protein